MRGQAAALSEAKTLHLDLLRDIKRLNDHLIAGSAYPVLEAAGELCRAGSQAIRALSSNEALRLQRPMRVYRRKDSESTRSFGHS